MAKCKDCGREHPPDQIANPHYCIARLGEQLEREEERSLNWARVAGANQRQINKLAKRIEELEKVLEPIITTWEKEECYRDYASARLAIINSVEEGISRLKGEVSDG